MSRTGFVICFFSGQLFYLLQGNTIFSCEFDVYCFSLEKANDFCAAKGEIAIIDNLDNETVNAYGAGSTAMNFRCGQANVQDSVQECYGTLWSGLEGTYGRSIVELIGSKVTPSETNYFGFEQLSDGSVPSEQETILIKKFGSGSSKCEQIRAGGMSIERQKMWLSAQNRRLSALAQLANGQISYGDYAVKLNNAAERLYDAAPESSDAYDTQKNNS